MQRIYANSVQKNPLPSIHKLLEGTISSWKCAFFTVEYLNITKIKKFNALLLEILPLDHALGHF